MGTIKTFKNYIVEMAPPPDDWDNNIFKQSFKKQLEYALERSKKIGQGSSRVAFEIEYKGRPTILKIAKNKKGLAQNEVESDWSMYNYYSCLCPLIDVDQENEPPRWLHFEKADKITKPQFKTMTGFDFDKFTKLLKFLWETSSARRRVYTVVDVNLPENQEMIENKLFSELFDLCVNWDIDAGDFVTLSNWDIDAGDFVTLSNWGIYDGSPVIIDAGFNSTVFKLYFPNKRR